MNPWWTKLRRVRRSLDFVWRHPLVAGDRPAAIGRYLRYNAAQQLQPGPRILPFVGGLRLLSEPGVAEAFDNHYTHLVDHPEMGFVVGFLRPGDRFVDIGANAGSYTVLAAGLARAQVIACEPSSAARKILRANIVLNDLESNCQVQACAVGDHTGEVTITTGRGERNRIAVEAHGGLPSDATAAETVPVTTLAALCSEPPTLLKIDVEGWEASVLDGAGELLGHHRLGAVIIELNQSGDQFGNSDESVHRRLVDAGLTPVDVDPHRARVALRTTWDAANRNTIYVRDPEEAAHRLSAAATTLAAMGDW